jgi:hypothetical protein
MDPRRRPAIERLLELVDTSVDGCWIPRRKPTSEGYIAIQTNSRHHYAHRVTYAYYRGPIPDGLQIDHLCRNRACCNPAHLEAVDARTNTLRSNAPSAKLAAKTHCGRCGDPFTRHANYRRCERCYLAYQSQWRVDNRERRTATQRLRRERKRAFSDTARATPPPTTDQERTPRRTTPP